MGNGMKSVQQSVVFDTVLSQCDISSFLRIDETRNLKTCTVQSWKDLKGINKPAHDGFINKK